MNISDTIAAISTPYGKGGIAVIRISGEKALEITNRIFEPAGKKALSEDIGRAMFGRIYAPGDTKKRQCIDEGIAVYFKAPRSFTGEDTVEISCHGGILVTNKVLFSALSAGARAAEAGEFTRRAFVNGKMKLTSAEALGDLLEASTEEQLRLAGAGMRGVLTESSEMIYNSLCHVLSSVYAHIDYPDEDLSDMSAEEMLECIKENISLLDRLLDTYKTGRAISEGIPTVIAGRTNAGKSSLYNCLVGRDAAIVTDIEGTTRDVLTESVSTGKALLKLSDTAGLRESNDEVERIGISRALEKIEHSELVLAVFDSSSLPTEEDIRLADDLKNSGKISICILNKSDVGTIDYSRVTDCFEYVIHLSAKTGDGIDDLKRTIEDIYIDKNLDTGNDAILANARQHAAALRARETLDEAYDSIMQEMPLEISCALIEDAMTSLGELDGRTVSDDIVSGIFSKFCVGK